jgi:hypothetical protein
VTTRTLAQRILDLERALDAIPHAFGGALALAYYAEPRATIDIDLNVFVPVERFSDVAAPLIELGASVSPAVADLVLRHGQARVMWDHTPLDLFFAYDPFHNAAAARRRNVPFAEATIPILGPEHLIVCKAVYSRSKDWVDIDAMIGAEVVVDAGETLRWMGRLAGDQDPRFDRLAAVLARR